MTGLSHPFLMQRHHPHMPFLVTAAAVALFSLMDALMKHASIAIGAYSALLLRSIIGTAIMVPLWRMRGGNWPAPDHLRIHILRALVSSGMALLFFHALTLLPMAEAVALSFISPLLALYLAAVMLGERISGKAVMASALGLGGVILISMVRFQSDVPSGQSLEGIAAVLVSAGLYAWNLVLQRQIAQIAPPADIALSQHAITALVLLLFAPWLAVAPATSELTILFLAAILATISLLLMAWSYARAEAQALVPVEYSGFLWAALFGWLFFAENVEIPTLVGGALIVVGCWIAAPRSEPEQMAA